MTPVEGHSSIIGLWDWAGEGTIVGGYIAAISTSRIAPPCPWKAVLDSTLVELGEGGHDKRKKITNAILYYEFCFCSESIPSFFKFIHL